MGEPVMIVKIYTRVQLLGFNIVEDTLVQIEGSI